MDGSIRSQGSTQAKDGIQVILAPRMVNQI